MFKRFSFVLATILIAGTAFVACDKKVDKTEPAAEAKVEVVDAAAVADAADVADAAKTADAADAADIEDGAKAADENAATNVEIPAEATAAMEGLLFVLDAIADAGSQATCDKVLADLKKLENDDIKAKLEGAKLLETLSDEIIESMQKSSSARMMGITIKMAGFQKCEDAPESAEIDATVKNLLSVVAEDPNTAKKVEDAETDV